MKKREAYLEKRLAQLDEYRAKAKVLKAKGRRAIAEGKIKGYKELDKLEDRIQSTKVELRKLQRAGEDSWTEMRKGFERAWTELRLSAMQARKRLGRGIK